MSLNEKGKDTNGHTQTLFKWKLNKTNVLSFCLGPTDFSKVTSTSRLITIKLYIPHVKGSLMYQWISRVHRKLNICFL